jgi:hypothetical protein
MKRVFALDVSRFTIVEVYRFCLVYDRQYTFSLEHRDGKSMLYGEEKC